MSQHYVDPDEVDVPDGSRPSKSLRRILIAQGQIVPCLVRPGDNGRWQAADQWQGDVVLACRELEWPTILVEDDWTEDDL